ncbi:MAG TPA: hypothetical protein PLX23_09795 [Candidatus Hydrogenedens sp.]|nr:hypothetical protein [Candidatus Hydrogenedens sp.]
MVEAILEEIRRCSPKTVNDREEYYFNNVYPKEHLIEIGKKFI